MKNKFILALGFLLITFVNAQDLDEDFLASLPDDIKEDLVEKNAGQGKSSEERYRPYLYSTKLSQAEELLKLKDRLEKDLQDLERRLKFDGSVDTDLKLYGSDFFNTFQTSFMPINEPNPDSGYTLDTGDVLNIQLTGQKNDIENYIITGDGSISLPDIGKIVIGGLTISQASALISARVNASFIGTEAFVGLDEIRDVNVLVTGNAKNPGIYTLTGNSNILHALSSAGGVSKFGSYREINLIRDNKIIESLDVYKLLIDGQYDLTKRLRSGDVIFIEARKNIVTIDGAVNRPAKYEVFDNQNLYTIIEYANGIKRTADRQNVSLERILDGTLKTIPVVNDSQFKTITAVDGDLIYIREYPYREAKISGAVMKPGTYTMAAEETLVDLIQKAGGYTSNAYIFGAIYQNEDAKFIAKKANEILYQEFLDNILAVSQQSIGQDFDLRPIVELTEQIKDSEGSGRVVIDLINDETSNLYSVKNGDELFIPEINNVVYVYGETSSEGAVMFSEDRDVDYFVEKSGGLKKFADKNSIYILHANGEAQLYSKKRNIFESSPRNKMQVYPGSIIFVPRELDDSTPKRLAAQAYVSILGNLGIALASLSSISKDN
jgi:protein involved in polysaccharide export with SLBB domain